MDERFTKRWEVSGDTVRESYVLGVPGRGAVEMWKSVYSGYEFGGIEVHSMHETEYATEISECHVLMGRCWTDGSGLAFDENKHLWDNPSAVRALLEEWSGQYLGV